MGGVVKKVKKIIPKEIRPAVPFAAAYFGPQFLTGPAATFAKANPNITRALIASGTSAAQGDDTKSVLRSGVLAAAPGVLSDQLQQASIKSELAKGFNPVSSALDTAAGVIRGASPLQTIGTQAAIEGSAQLAEIQQDQIDAYNRQLQEQGVMNKVKRRQGIFDIYMNAGYDADYVNSVLDKYGYADGGEVEEEMSEVSLSPGKGKMTEIEKTLYAKEEGGDKSEGIMKARRAKRKKDDNEGDLASGLAAAAQGVERAFGRGFGNVEPVPMLRFARGGEVEEEVSESGIMSMSMPKDDGDVQIASDINNERVLEQLFEEFLDMGLSPEDAAKAAREAFDRMSSKPREGIMQMASGYKTDIEEMYEQYVFEMEEMGLQPMSFSEFLAQARAGMADGGDVMSAEEYFKEKGKQEKLNNMERMRREYEEYKYKKKYGPRNEAKDGGIMEKDMRGGGFIPEGSKEKADDVPARLSKNEFVMTADAVRAAGGGSVNKGAKRMYDLMYTLEGKI